MYRTSLILLLTILLSSLRANAESQKLVSEPVLTAFKKTEENTLKKEKALMTAETIQKNLATAGVTLPTPTKAVANYVGYVRSGNLVIISGQLPMQEGKVVYEGPVRDETIDVAYKAARLCAINILAQLFQALEGDWNRLERCVRLGGFVASSDAFKAHPKVINGASDLMVEILGEKGRHARAAVGVSSLPLGASVEVEAVFEIMD